MSFRAHLAHVALSVDDVEGLAAYYESTLGLTRQGPAGSAVRLGWGVGHHALELHAGPAALGHFAFEVPDPDQLEALSQRLEGAWVDGAFVTTDPDGNTVLFLGRVDRSGERVGGERRPLRIQHITLASPQRATLVEFYERVGFRVSDHMGDVFTWLRSDHEHHSLAIVAAEEPGLDHFSFDLSNWGDFKVWCDDLATRGQQIAWGPGRHGPGNNLFVIFLDPAGHRVELSAEMERYWDDRAEQQPRNWESRPDTVNLWGPVPSWRRTP